MGRCLAGFFLLTLLLAACGGPPSLPAATAAVPPTATPRVLPPTRTLLWESPTPSLPSTLTALPPLPPTAAPMPATDTPSPAEPPGGAPLPPLAILFSGCNTSLDIRHGMGEVTNAYVTVRNYGSADLTGVCATLAASDEARPHPDKTRCLPALPALHQALLKLTADTGFRADTSIQVSVISDQGFFVSDSRPSCRALGLPGWIPARVGVLEPIP